MFAPFAGHARRTAALILVVLAASPAAGLGLAPLAGLPESTETGAPTSCPPGNVNCVLSETITLLQDALNSTLAQVVLGNLNPHVRNATGNDADADGRTDYYYVEAGAAPNLVCSLLQSDFVWDETTPEGSGGLYEPLPQDAGGLPNASGTSDVRATLMLYAPSPQTGAACTGTAPDVAPLVRVGGRLRVHLGGGTGLLGANESDPTRLSLWVNDTEQYRIEVFTRAAGETNGGTHVVLRSFNPSRLDLNATVAGANYGFLTPADLTNLHVLSGGVDLSNPPSSVVVNPAPVVNHDWDDDGHTDVVEVLANTGNATRRVNPLNACSTPQDFDGDGLPNGVDATPTVPDAPDCAFGWALGVTNPVAGSTQSGNVTVNWTATQVNPDFPALDHFKLTLVNATHAKVLGDGIPAANRSHPWFSHTTRFADDLRDGDYAVHLRAFDATGASRAVASGTFTLENFNHTISVTAPAGGSTQSKDVSVQWTATPARANQLAIDHFDVVAVRQVAGNPETVLNDTFTDPAVGGVFTFTWKSHETRFPPLNVKDGDYKVKIVAHDDAAAGQRRNATQAEAFSLKNFDYTVTVTDPPGGSTRNGTFWINWTATPLNAGQLDIDHFRVRVEKANDELQNRVINNSVLAADRALLWDSAAATVDDPVFFTDGDYKINVTAADAGVDFQSRTGKSGTFTLSNRVAPNVANLAVADANGVRDLAGFVAGALNVTFNVTGGRSDAATRTFSLDLFRCSVPGGVDGQKLTVDPITGTAARGANVVTIDANLMRENFTGLAPCAPAQQPGNLIQTNPTLNNLTRGLPSVNPDPTADDGNLRVKLTVTETHEGLSVTSAVQAADGRAFNNRLPSLSGLAASRLDQAAAPDGLPVANQVRFTANVTDPEGGCLGRLDPPTINGGPTGQPQLVEVRVMNAAGLQVATANMNRANVPLALTPGGIASGAAGAGWQATQHVANCPRSVPATNSNIAAGVLHEALVALPPGDYTWQVAVRDAHGNNRDGNATLGHGALVLAGPAPLAVPAFAAPDALGLAQEAIDTAWDALENNGERNCDLNNDGSHATECEDVLPLVGSAVQGLPGALPNAWGLARGCLGVGGGGIVPTGNCISDRDLDGDRDAVENATGSDWLNPYSNTLDPDADLLLNASSLLPIGVEGTVADVNLYRIDWVRTGTSTPCGAGDNHAAGCVGKLRVLSSGKFVTVRDPQALGNPNAWLVKVEESPGNLAKVSTTQAGGLSWTLVDGVVGVDPTGGRIRAYVNASDGQRVADLTLDLTKIGVPGEAFLSLELLGGANSFGVDVHSNPVNVVQSGTVSTPAGALDTEVDLNRTIRFVAPGSSAPASCSAAGGSGTWLRADRNANNSWTVCASANGARQGPVTTPVNFFPTGGVFFGSDGLPVLWLDRNGDRAYQNGERLNPNPLDLDGDGWSNVAEVQAGSNPLHPGSTPQNRGLGFPGDWDADHAGDLAEVAGGSNPLQACSVPAQPNGWPTDPDCEGQLPL